MALRNSSQADVKASPPATRTKGAVMNPPAPLCWCPLGEGESSGSPGLHMPWGNCPCHQQNVISSSLAPCAAFSGFCLPFARHGKMPADPCASCRERGARLGAQAAGAGGCWMQEGQWG